MRNLFSRGYRNMKKFWFTLVIILLVIVGADEYANRDDLRIPNLFQPQVRRHVILKQHRLPKLKAPGDVSRETHQVVLKHPIHYHGYFDSKNKTAYLNDIRMQAFRNINKERSKRHLPALKLNQSLNKVASLRAVQANQNFDHYNRAGQALSAVDAAKLHVSPSYLNARTHLSECLSEQVGDVDNTAVQVAHSAVNGMIYHDAGSHWGHRKILLDPKNRLIGITAYIDKAKDNKVVVAYELYQ
ncbi:CAP domain-containing protein [Acetilactobacillus jinshanensis]|uniref:SCP domain-containing protein n=1 Tax=Acetilactobacillus jinshanensis TaxID=1720083 RepID=A0A4P6ZJE6_9LACO|nr:CAP domain-containing protein [Acetilactobacillus jinshanensis]QBP17734.1 hypothetical protein ELX58_00770 [Acetilactobacillus jinshanensis]URL60596.1 hypothetical protein HGK75_00780 [uncultured bacterium]